MKVFYRIKQVLTFWDPSFESLVFAIEVAMSALMSVFFWMYTQKPCTCLMITVAPVAIMTTLNVNSIHSKIRNSFFACLGMGTGAFLISIFSQHSIFLILSLGLLIFLCFILPKYSFMTITAWTVATFMGIPSGLDQGLFRLCETGVSFIFILVCIIITELIFARIIMRRTLIYISKSINDIYFMTVSLSDAFFKSILEKYIHKESLFFRTNIYADKVLECDNDKVFYVVYKHIMKADIIFNDKQFFFKLNTKYAKALCPILDHYKQIFRTLRFLENYRKKEFNTGNSLLNSDIFENKLMIKLERVSEQLEEKLGYYIKIMNRNNESWNIITDNFLSELDLTDKEQYTLFYGLNNLTKELSLLSAKVETLNLYKQ